MTKDRKSFWQSVRHGQEPGVRGIWNRTLDYILGTIYSWIRRYQARRGGEPWDL